MENVVHMASASQREIIKKVQQILDDLKAGRVVDVCVAWTDSDGDAHYFFNDIKENALMESVLRRASTQVAKRLWE